MWDAIYTRLRERWTIAQAGSDWCGLVIELDGEPQKVVVKPTVGLPQPLVIVAAQVCAMRDVEPAHALRYNAIAPRGALALEQEMLVLRQLVTADEVESTVEALAREALRLRRAAGDLRENPALTHWAE